MADAVRRFKEAQYRVLVGLAHPERMHGLMSIAAIFARRRGGRIVAVAVVASPAGADPDPTALSIAEAVVHRAEQFGAELGMAVEPVVQQADDVATGIVAAADRVQADMVLLGLSPPSAAGEGQAARITEQVARTIRCSLTIVALGDDDEHPRLLMPIKEDFDPGITADLARIAALFGGASLTLLGLVPADLADGEFEARATALADRVKALDIGQVRRLRPDSREAAQCMFGAEIHQMTGEALRPAFVLLVEI